MRWRVAVLCLLVLVGAPALGGRPGRPRALVLGFEAWGETFARDPETACALEDALVPLEAGWVAWIEERVTAGGEGR